MERPKDLVRETRQAEALALREELSRSGALLARVDEASATTRTLVEQLQARAAALRRDRGEEAALAPYERERLLAEQAELAGLESRVGALRSECRAQLRPAAVGALARELAASEELERVLDRALRQQAAADEEELASLHAEAERLQAAVSTRRQRAWASPKAAAAWHSAAALRLAEPCRAAPATPARLSCKAGPEASRAGRRPLLCRG